MRLIKATKRRDDTARYFKVGALCFSKEVSDKIDCSKGYAYIDVEEDKVIFTPTEDEENGFTLKYVGFGLRLCCKQLGNYLPEKTLLFVTINEDGSFWVPRTAK